MPFVNHRPFFGIIDLHRVVWIGGKYGGHKTALAYRIAQDFLEKGYRLVSNNKSVWNDDPEKVRILPDSGKLRAVVIMDEGGMEIKAGKQVEQLVTYARKMDVIYLVPSHHKPHREMRDLSVEPVWSLHPAGIPYVHYKWTLRTANFQDGGDFGWLFPGEIYGIYSTQDPGASMDLLAKWLIRRTDEFRQWHGHGALNSLSALAAPTEAELLLDAAEQIAEATYSQQAVSSREPRRRRGKRR